MCSEQVHQDSGGGEGAQGYTKLRCHIVGISNRKLRQKTNKNEGNGYVERFKSRLVVLGYMQREHVHYDPAQTYGHVISYDSFRMVLSIGAARNWEIRYSDITSAFLQCTIDKKFYMRHPLGEKWDDGTPKVVKLLKGQYCLIQSPRLFTNAL